MMRLTSRPAILPASLVAWRCESSKYAGTVMTASVTGSPRTVLFAGHFYFGAIAAFDDFVAHKLEVALNFFVIEIAAYEALDFVNGVPWVGDLLATSHLANKAFALFVDRHD